MRRQAKMEGKFFVEPEAKLIFCTRIHSCLLDGGGSVGAQRSICGSAIWKRLFRSTRWKSDLPQISARFLYEKLVAFHTVQKFSNISSFFAWIVTGNDALSCNLLTIFVFSFPVDILWKAPVPAGLKKQKISKHVSTTVARSKVSTRLERLLFFKKSWKVLK